MSSDTRHPGHNTRLFTAAFCPSCHFSFMSDHDSRVCPSCGRALGSMLDETSDLHAQHPGEPHAPISKTNPGAYQACEVDELIGQQLGVYNCDALLGAATAPDRHHHVVPDGAGQDTVLLLMPAWTPGGYLGVKLATVAPGNAAKGLPTVIASYLLHEAATGRPLALMDDAIGRVS